MSGDTIKRLLNEDKKPRDKEILGAIGEKGFKAWNDIRKFIETYYDFSPELKFYGKKYGWTVQYRKSGKTLCSMFPEMGAFTVLLTLGKKEVEMAMKQLGGFNEEVKDKIIKTPQLHDGKWLWIRLSDMSNVDDIKKLIKLKRRPKAVKT